MNIFAVILGALQTHYAAYVQELIVGIPVFFIQGLLTLVDDERSILAQAMHKLLADRRAGKSWEEALTDCYNVFYNGEVSEANKIAMAFLEKLSKLVEGLPTAAA